MKSSGMRLLGPFDSSTIDLAVLDLKIYFEIKKLEVEMH
jgi:hypothetical protein